MRNAKGVSLLAVALLLAVSVSAFAQVDSGNWPTYYHDYQRSGRSPATVIAKPSVKWAATLSSGGSVFDYAALGGIVVDHFGNSYVNSTGAGGSSVWCVKVDRLGARQWKGNIASLGGQYWGGPTVRSDGSILVGPGWASSKIMSCLDASTGNALWSFNFNATGGFNYGSDNSPTVAPDGAIYCANQQTPYDKGRICAIKADHTGFKWTYGVGLSGNVELGQNIGSMPVKVVDGKNVIFASGAQTYTGHATVGEANTVALRDNGTSVTKLWGAQTGFHYAHPNLSNDGSTVYQASFDSWMTPGSLYPETLWALNADTGLLKWKLATGGNHLFPPAIGADGTLYLTSGNVWEGATNCVGQLIAVTDNGTSGTVKWRLYLPDETWADGANPVVISTNPTTIYIGTGFSPNTSRVYCIQDMGTYAKILWRYEGSCADGGITAMAAMDDGTVLAAWGSKLYAFDAGFDPDTKIGISGRVVDGAGNPIANAWVAASQSPRPLPDNSCRIWVPTDGNGCYWMGTETAGTYYVAAWAKGYKGSEDVVVTLTAGANSGVNNAATADFTLGSVGYNWAFAAKATTNLPNSNAAYAAPWAVDGDLTTRFASSDLVADQMSAAKAHQLTVDLGQNRSIDEVVAYFEYAFPADYQLESLPDGGDPATGWTVRYLKAGANGGAPLDYYGPLNATWKTAADVIKFPAAVARYWRITGTKQSCCTNMSVWEMEVHDSLLGPLAPVADIAAASAAADGSLVRLDNVICTGANVASGGGIPSNTLYVEAADRTVGLRVQVPGAASLGIGSGDKVSVAGTMKTTAFGERYVDAIVASRRSSAQPIVAVGMNNRDASSAQAMGLFVKLWGNVTSVGTDNFVITDGSSVPVTAMCGTTAKPTLGSGVRVRGIVSKDASGPVLYMRAERADWTYADATYQPLPLPGAYKYPREFAICGPFADAKSTTGDGSTTPQQYRLNHDFISDATGALLTEMTIRPSVGTLTGDKLWKRADASNDQIDFIAEYPSSTNCTYYAHLWIYSPQTQALAMRVGSDDSVKIWSNGVSVYSQLASHVVTIGDYGVSTVPLRQGMNSILFKVEQSTGASGLNCQFVPPGASGKTGYGGYPAWTDLGYLLSFSE